MLSHSEASTICQLSILLLTIIVESEMATPPAASQLTKVLAGLRHTFVVADATLPDMPLVFASEGCVHAWPMSFPQHLNETQSQILCDVWIWPRRSAGSQLVSFRRISLSWAFYTFRILICNTFAMLRANDIHCESASHATTRMQSILTRRRNGSERSSED